MARSNTKFQLLPPNTRRANYAERSIWTFKNNFKYYIVSLDTDFPMTEWDRFLYQSFPTINVLREVSYNPMLL